MQFDQFMQYLISGITSGSIYALIALGFTLIYNSTQLINFAQGEFVMLGGLITVSLYTAAGLPLVLAIIIAIAIVTAIGVIFERLAIRPLRNSSIITLIIVTVGASILFKNVAMILWGRDPQTLPPFTGDKPIPVLGASVVPQTIWVVCILLVTVILLQVFYKRSIIGKAMKACSINPSAAQLMGINTSSIVMLSFAMSAAFGAVAGILITPISMTSYSVGSFLGLKGFAGAVLGGLDNPLGAVVGGLLLGVLESLSVGVIDSGYKDAIAFLILLLVLFFKPSGILGARITRIKEKV
ncbi:MAG: branched-chain amino acid ABC transporter permease [Candidatus Aquicultor secundus]|uniref:branched-chain amino acid ABC transporter permease n=2 Tax=Candidatus Aquicultor secundus TaxID=1973895 RepID=UPI00091F2BFD|nr:branched-chain amino acid ABC transporter permease [Candidatus Aquicultor secundus]NCO65043.1 branched-chain amino acid ABC transporter permease [Solirubrobacter sp.]OIO85291.1 MAG: branched-chain amino acid ABC transporter permease [Candidatus Aquicultor secundus]PIU27967.1 MAG: branched-chain amino acid ABC transporter permease [Candidatus Aquicultor secundus]PIX52104.1 MAG: branched-chain amino acid ABC transporter permease [Candidatus Aquicultor secundus]PIY40573.1 MAG: branched-chain a